MAGIKITDLQTLTSPVSEDLLYIVDVSDTTQSPQGTSKQIELGNIVSGGEGGFNFGELEGAILSATLISAIYSRVGNAVNCSIHGSVNAKFDVLDSGTFIFSSLGLGYEPSAIGTITINSTKNINGILLGTRIRFYSEDTSLTDITFEFVATFQMLRYP